MKRVKVLTGFLVIVAINFSINANVLEKQKSNTTSLFQLKVAHADGAEYSDPSWQDFANWLESIDEWAGVNNAIGDNTPTDQMFDAIHQYCDDWDISGDPEYDWAYDEYGNAAYAQTDDCDGQPNLC